MMIRTAFSRHYRIERIRSFVVTLDSPTPIRTGIDGRVNGFVVRTTQSACSLFVNFTCRKFLEKRQSASYFRLSQYGGVASLNEIAPRELPQCFTRSRLTLKSCSLFVPNNDAMPITFEAIIHFFYYQNNFK
jgi:hypothetical protein